MQTEHEVEQLEMFTKTCVVREQVLWANDAGTMFWVEHVDIEIPNTEHYGSRGLNPRRRPF